MDSERDLRREGGKKEETIIQRTVAILHFLMYCFSTFRLYKMESFLRPVSDTKKKGRHILDILFPIVSKESFCASIFHFYLKVLNVTRKS